jgi:hypothetical protein
MIVESPTVGTAMPNVSIGTNMAMAYANSNRETVMSYINSNDSQHPMLSRACRIFAWKNGYISLFGILHPE